MEAASEEISPGTYEINVEFEDAEPESTSATFKVVITDASSAIAELADLLLDETEPEVNTTAVANITYVPDEEEEDEDEPLLVWIESISQSG